MMDWYLGIGALWAFLLVADAQGEPAGRVVNPGSIAFVVAVGLAWPLTIALYFWNNR